MKFTNNFARLISVLFCLIMIGGVLSAADNATKQVSNNMTSSLAEKLWNTGENVFGKIFGWSPVAHGLLGGAFSAINTYKKLDDTIKFTTERDKVNISGEDNKKEYIDEDIIFDYNKDIRLTDQNVLDLIYIQTVPLSTLNDANSPTFRMAEDTTEELVYDLNNNRVNAQKRGMLFEDINNTIKNNYEFRNLVIKYKKATYTGKVKVDLDLGDLTGGMTGLQWLTPFITGSSEFTKELILNKLDKKKFQEARDMTDVLQTFHLQFNSRTDENASLELEQLDCTTEDGQILGTTGEEVIPKTVFDWIFDSGTSTALNGNPLTRNTWCDVDVNGIFCDATQFSIEVLNKINLINNYVSDNKDQFVCPAPGIEGSIITDVNNVGISALSSAYNGVNKVNVNYTVNGWFDINSAYVSEYWFDLVLTLYQKNTSGSWDLKDTETITVSGTDLNNSGHIYDGNKQMDIEYLTLPTDLKVEAKLENFTYFYSFVNGATYEIIPIRGTQTGPEEATLEVSLEQLDLIEDNNLTNIFTSESETCSLEHTSTNIKLFDNEVSQSFNIDNAEFKAYLMKDGYSDDFRHDFDEQYRTAFLASPIWYYDNSVIDPYNPLYKYFADMNGLFEFRSSTSNLTTGQFVLPGPGRYEVQVVIHYDDQWRLFNDAGDPTGSIEIIMDRELLPQLDMPLYYMPIDGLVGSTSSNSRQGYGVDYIGDIVTIDKDIPGLTTEGYVSSNPINTVNVTEIKSFETMNDGAERGKLLSVTTDSSHENPEMRYLPAIATPVVLKVANAQNDAYAFYKLSVGAPEGQGGTPGNPGLSMAYWTGVGECKDFTGISVQEAFLNVPDISAMESELAPTTPSQSITYGVEWNKDIITRTGNVFLRTVFYTPANYTTGTGISELYMDSQSDDAMFYAPGVNGGSAGTLESGDEIKLNHFLGDANKVQSLRQIFDLVKNKNACVNYTSTNFEVFYNPKKVAESFLGDTNSEAQKEFIDARAGCIEN